MPSLIETARDIAAAALERPGGDAIRYATAEDIRAGLRDNAPMMCAVVTALKSQEMSWLAVGEVKMHADSWWWIAVYPTDASAWDEPVVYLAQWIDHNGGGFTWHGNLGEVRYCMPASVPAPPAEARPDETSKAGA